MTDNWDFYLCRVRGKPASVYVDLGAIEHAPHPTHSHMAYISLRMQAPRSDGLSGGSEVDRLAAVEEALQAGLTAEKAALYVGRNTCDGLRDLFFYIRPKREWERQVARIMTSFPDYLYTAKSRSDPDWTTYRNFLYPAARDLQRIRNRRTCEALRRHGDMLAVSREIEHWIALPTDAATVSFIEEAGKLGYQVRDVSQPDSENAHYCVRIWRLDLPDFSTIDEATLPLHDLAQQFGGSYGGWETGVVMPPGAASRQE